MKLLDRLLNRLSGILSPHLSRAFQPLSDVLKQRRKIIYALAAILLITAWIDLWFVGSVTLLFSDWDLALYCFRSPVAAPFVVLKHANLETFAFLNLIFFALFLLIFFEFSVRYPDITGRLTQKTLNVSNDPVCGTSDWITPKEASQHYEFGRGAGILIGRYGEKIVRYNSTKNNRNSIIFGPPGSGKTTCFILPNMFQAASTSESVIVTDPKGELLKTTAGYFRSKGYIVRVFNLIDLSQSDRWNPLKEVTDDFDADLLAQIIIENTKGPLHRPGGSDLFWERSELNLLKALILYAKEELDGEKCSLAGVYDLLSRSRKRLSAEERGDGEEEHSIHKIFRSLPKTHPAVAPYNLFSQADHRVMGNIITGLGTRLHIFQSQKVRELTSASDIDLTLPGRHKCAYFCVIPDTDQTLAFLSSLYFSFLFLRLTRQADAIGGSNTIPVNFILDEFCNIGTIPEFTKKIATMRSRNINCMIVTQSLPQLKNRYPEGGWEEIISCSALRIILGATEYETAEYLSKLLGQATVEQVSFRRRAGVLEPAQVSIAPRARALLDPSEICRLPYEKGVALLIGAKPLLFNKIHYTQHPEAQNISAEKYIPFRRRITVTLTPPPEEELPPTPKEPSSPEPQTKTEDEAEKVWAELGAERQ